MLWRILEDKKASPQWNMATDEALLCACLQPILRLYKWEKKSLSPFSLGYFQSWEEVPQGHPFVRRYTGGGLVDHRSDITYSMIVPSSHFLYSLPARKSYRLIHEIITSAAKKIGLKAKLGSSEKKSISSFCFEKAVRWDVLIGNQKIAGAAQRRTRNAFLHQGSVLLPFSEKNKDFRIAFLEIFRNSFQEEFAVSALNKEEEKIAEELKVNRYQTRDWNYRR